MNARAHSGRLRIDDIEWIRIPLLESLSAYRRLGHLMNQSHLLIEIVHALDVGVEAGIHGCGGYVLLGIISHSRSVLALLLQICLTDV